MSTLCTPPLPTPERLSGLLAALEHGLLERGTAVRLALLAALAGEHVLLVGPPGTAKSELARRLHHCLAGARYFERLLTRFSTPEELFGPLSLKALEDDRYERLTAGYLPTAGVAFLDEVFKANSAILNTLLTLLNEREFDNGAGRLPVPLACVVGATNEPPADEALLAFHDRFLLRVPVAPVGDASFAALLEPAPAPLPVSHPLAEPERQAVLAAAAGVTLGADAQAALAALRGWLAEQQQPVSDRRWRRLAALLRVQAASEGRAQVDELHLWLLPYVVCADVAQVPAVAQWFAQRLGAVPQPLPWLEHAVTGFEKQLGLEQRAEAEEGDNSAGKMALVRAMGGREQGPMRLLSEHLEEQMRRHWSPVHVAARVAQLDELLAPVQAHREQVAQALQALATRLAGRLWLPPGLAAALLGAHEQTLAGLDALLARAANARRGFAELPVDDTLPAQAPEPVALAG